MTAVHHVETTVHGRYLLDDRGADRLLIGFHGYGETADTSMEAMHRIPGIESWSVAAIQALHPFYIKGGSVVAANWMTKQDRELAIADNLAYVRRVVDALPPTRIRVFLGFSQGVAMAFRAAAAIRCDGVIALGGDVPPDVHPPLPPVLLGRGTADEWYTEEKMKKDVELLGTGTATCVFDGGHEWTDAFCRAVGELLATVS